MGEPNPIYWHISSYMGEPNPIYWHISSYSFILSTYFFIERHISFIFLYIFHIFLHIFDIFLHQIFFTFLAYSFLFWHIPSYFRLLSLYFSHIPSFTTSWNSRTWCHEGGGRTRKSWNYPLGPDLEIFLSPRTFFWMVISPNVTSSGERGCTRKSWYYLAGHKT